MLRRWLKNTVFWTSCFIMSRIWFCCCICSFIWLWFIWFCFGLWFFWYCLVGLKIWLSLTLRRFNAFTDNMANFLAIHTEVLLLTLGCYMSEFLAFVALDLWKITNIMIGCCLWWPRKQNAPLSFLPSNAAWVIMRVSSLRSS